MDDAIDWLEDRHRVDDLVLFLDFDGTLAPIVDRPGEARPLDGIAGLLEQIGAVVPVAVVSGRGLADVRSRLGAESVSYAGSHGLEVAGADGRVEISDRLQRLKSRVDDYEQQLRSRFSEVPRVEIERKPFSVAVHFRRRPEAREIVEKAIEKIAGDDEDFEMGIGKMVRELQPEIEVDKGTALQKLRGRLDPERHRTPVYIGDDTTDEDAFEAVADEGLGILVADEPRESAARARLDDPPAVRDFLRLVVRRLDGDLSAAEG